MARSRTLKAAMVTMLLLTMLTGCAERSVSIRTLPPETPAADTAAAVKAMAALTAAQAVQQVALNPRQQPGGATAVQASGAAPGLASIPVTPADAPPLRTPDPWERLNRFTYRFNARFDEAVLLPVANRYGRLPSPIRTGVRHFFSNLSEVKTTVNYVGQWRLGFSARSLGRLLINSTLGIGGLFDVAAHFKLPSAPTGSSATLSTWGVHQGPYLVIPLLGPSTLRDSVGLLCDFGIAYGINLADLYRGDQSWVLDGVDAVNVRAHTPFRYYATGSPFEYEAIRFLYVRKGLIEDEALHPKHRR